MVTDRQKHQPSLYNGLRLLEQDCDLAKKKSLEIESLRQRLDAKSTGLEKVRDFREKRVAHWDPDEPQDLVNEDEGRDVLKELQAIFNDIYEAIHPGMKWSFIRRQGNDTTHMLEALKRSLPSAGVKKEGPGNG